MDADEVALVGLGQRVGRGGGEGNILICEAAVGRRLPLVANRRGGVVAVGGERRGGGEEVALGMAARVDRNGQRRRNVEHCGGGGAVGGHALAGVVGE